jgi:integrase
MKIDVQYLQKRTTNQWRYRRKIPPPLRPFMRDRREWVAPLGRTEAEALRGYAAAHARAEKDFRTATALLKGGARDTHAEHGPTRMDLYDAAKRQLVSLGLDPEWIGATDGHDPEAEARDVIADSIAALYPVDEEGNPTGIRASDAALLRVLMGGRTAARPDPTVEEAKRLYLEERVGDDDKKQQELERVFGYVAAALGRDRTLKSLKREDAKEVRNYMLDGRKPASVDRYLNVVRAVFNHAIKEYDLDWRNPFMGLEVVKKDKAEPDRDKRKPFPVDALPAMRRRLTDARPDLFHIWQMLEGTGCRLAEVTGLRVEDVYLVHAMPHIVVEWHDSRRIKNSVSRRRVPLIGDALVAAREAVKAAAGSPVVFPAYGRLGGASSASAALGKHVREVVADTKVTTHSLRHLMKDRLRLAGVSKTDQDIVLGHSSGSEGEKYGGDVAVLLEVAERALRKALDII